MVGNGGYNAVWLLFNHARLFRRYGYEREKQPELGAVRVGATRGEIELQLGAPIEVREENGRRVDIYEYEIGNEPSAGRAIGHGVMDVLTLGIWEVVGTPVEGFQGEKNGSCLHMMKTMSSQK